MLATIKNWEEAQVLKVCSEWPWGWDSYIFLRFRIPFGGNVWGSFYRRLSHHMKQRSVRKVPLLGKMDIRSCKWKIRTWSQELIKKRLEWEATIVSNKRCALTVKIRVVPPWESTPDERCLWTKTYCERTACVTFMTPDGATDEMF